MTATPPMYRAPAQGTQYIPDPADVNAASPTWDILIPTLGERRRLFERLLMRLLPQTDAHRGQARVIGWFNNGSPALPSIRQAMIERSEADYVSFVDDDDLVTDDYVSAVTGALEARPDYVGFQVQCYSDGRPTGIADHSLKYESWTNEPGRYFRDISHINPIRRDIALTADFRQAKVGAAEDRAWVEQLRRGGLLKTEVYLPKIVYHYLYSTRRTPGEGTRWKRPQAIHQRDDRSPIEHPNFTWSDRA